MCLLATARFRLRNATLSGKVHTYSLELHEPPENISKSHLLPFYGNVCAQLFVQPTSLAAPLAQGTLDVFFVEGGVLLQRMFCVLQGCSLKCYDSHGLNQRGRLREDEDFDASMIKSLSLLPELTIPLDQNSLVEPTAFQTALRLNLVDPSGKAKPRHFLCIAGSQSAFLGWKNAINLQILDSGECKMEINLKGDRIPIFTVRV